MTNFLTVDEAVKFNGLSEDQRQELHDVFEDVYHIERHGGSGDELRATEKAQAAFRAKLATF